MELLEQGRTFEAVHLLQGDLREKALQKDRLHELAQLIMAAFTDQAATTDCVYEAEKSNES